MPCHRDLNSVPAPVWRATRLRELRVFGCLCYPNLSATTPHKMSPRSVACAFIGYPAEHRGYRCIDLDTRWVYTSRHGVFDETTFPFRRRSSSPAPAPARVDGAEDTPVFVPPQRPPPHTPPSSDMHTPCSTPLNQPPSVNTLRGTPVPTPTPSPRTSNTMTLILPVTAPDTTPTLHPAPPQHYPALLPLHLHVQCRR
jgi:histone deacetylase 1/2